MGEIGGTPRVRSSRDLLPFKAKWKTCEAVCVFCGLCEKDISSETAFARFRHVELRG